MRGVFSFFRRHQKTLNTSHVKNIEANVKQNLPLNIQLQNIYGLTYVSLVLLELKGHKKTEFAIFIVEMI